jgi:O-antigen ligase
MFSGGRAVPWRFALRHPALWICAGAGAAVGSFLSLTWQAAIAGAFGVATLALGRPETLLIFIIVSAGINLSPSIGGTMDGGGDSKLDLNAIRLLGVLAATILLALRNFDVVSSLRRSSAFLAFLCFGAISLIWAPDRTEGTRFLLQLAYPMAAFGLTVATMRAGGRRTVPEALIWGSWVGILVNLAVFLSSAPPQGEVRFFRYYGSLASNPLGLFSAVAVLALYGTSQWSNRTLSLATCLIMFVQLVATGSRTSLVALACALAVFELLRRRWSRLCAIVIVAGLVWIVVPAISTRPGISVSTSQASTLASLTKESNLSGRLFIWYDIWTSMISGAEVIGRGIGSSTAYMAARYSSLRSTHSEVIRLIAETGIVGLVLFVGGLLSVGWQLARRARNARGPGRETAQVGIAGLVLLVVACGSENALVGYAYFVAPIWVLVGMGITSDGHSFVKPGGQNSECASGQ